MATAKFNEAMYKALASGKPLTKKQQKQTKKMITRELRSKSAKKAYYHDRTDFVNQNGTLYNINYPAKGVEPYERLDNQFRIKKLDMRINMAIGDETNMVRIILGLWHQESLASVQQVLNTPIVTVAPEYLASFQNVNSKQFTIFRDKTYYLSKQEGTSSRYARMTKTWKDGLPIQMAGDTVSSQSIRNRIFVLLISDSTIVTDPQIDIAYRLDYMDI